MITFKQFLSETRQAPLYHGTRFDRMHDILHDNTLKTSVRNNTKHYNGKGFDKAISLTRSLKTALEWVNYRGVIIELDRDKLRQKYKIRPVNMANIWDMHWDEMAGVSSYSGNNPEGAKREHLFEEFIDTNITNIKKYITALHIPASESYRVESDLYKGIKIVKF